MTNYRNLRLSNLNTPEFRHLLLLLYWAAFGLVFLLLERVVPRASYHVVRCALDDIIPFCEWFMIPYMFWFVFMAGMLVYLLAADVPAFRRYMYFIMVTYSVSIVVFCVYPTCQRLRPQVFLRDNFLIHFIQGFYVFDTNTNVCPSLHCVGSMAVVFAAWDTERFRRRLPRLLVTALGLLISVSTVFVKQHSAVDVFWGMVLSAVGYGAVYVIPRLGRKEKVRKWQKRAIT